MSTDKIITLVAFAFYMILMIVIGIFYSRKTKNNEDYFLGGRNLGGWTAALSAQASDMSGWLLMGLPGAVYLAGTGEVWIAIGLLAGTILNWYIVSARLRKYTIVAGNSLTIPSFFENRYRDKRGIIKIVAAIIIALFFAVYTASAFRSGAKLFETLFGDTIENAYVIGLVIAAVVILIYTLLGGFKAVCTTDFIQGMLMLVAILAVPIVAYTIMTWDTGFASALQSKGVEGLTQEDIRLFPSGLILLQGITPPGSQIGQPQPGSVLPDQRHLPLRQVKSLHMSTGQQGSRVHGFAAGRRADIQKDLISGQARSRDREHGTLILDCPFTIPVTGQVRQTAGFLHIITVPDPSAGHQLRPGRGQVPEQSLPLLPGHIWHDPDTDRPLRQQCGQKLPGLFPAQLFVPEVDDPLGHGITDRKGFRFRIQLTSLQIPGDITEQTVDISRNGSQSDPFGQPDRFIAGGGSRYRIHIKQLVQSHTEDDPDFRLLGGHGLFGISVQDRVQFHLSLDHTFRQPFDESPPAGFQIRETVQGIPDQHVHKGPLLMLREQEVQNDLPFISALFHFCEKNNSSLFI